MVLDVTKYTPEECLFVLGDDDDWVLVFRDDYPDLTITKAWRQALLEWIGVKFARWVLNGIHYELTWTDTRYDGSGDLEKHPLGAEKLKTLYTHLTYWLEDEYIGDWLATYESYYGKHWLTFGDEFDDHMHSVLASLIREQFSEQFEDAEDEDAEEIWYAIYDGELATQALLTYYIGQFTTSFVWEKFEQSAYKQIADEQRHYLHLQELADDILNWWKTTFPDLQNQRIDKPDYKALLLEPQLEVKFRNFSQEWLRFIASHGIRGNVSNSVDKAISEIARKLL
ncbi:MAG: hypothetical protein MUE54_12090 [Anaerolineae bacterium]|jgi:hypothetical protein|nr:hypothetical protein [Anaerolineae bacterium]